jgi:hypothetical protein
LPQLDNYGVKNLSQSNRYYTSGTFDQKLDIESAKLDIRNKLLAFSNTVSEKTINHAIRIFSQYGKEGCFGRTNVEQITGLKSSAASNLIKLMKDSNLITPVTGQGKGKYRFG